ncbi:MAG TPA: carbohydrate ABC transporter permease [Actinotalea sp.]|nr:carbohydrate ABC transporter permease [Actinotalea sp.]
MFEVRHRSSRVLLQLLAAVMTVPFLLPLVEMGRGAFAGRGVHNFVVVWQTGVVPTFFRNSAILSVAVIALVWAGSMTAAFGFSKLRGRGKELYFWMMIVALTLPEVILLSPLFVTFTTLQLYNTLIAVVLPLAALQLPFAVLLARNFYDGVQNELIDAARIDGASVRQLFWHVVLPLTRPIASAIVVLTLINTWNSYLLPLVFLQDRANQVVTLLPQFFVGQDSTRTCRLGS